MNFTQEQYDAISIHDRHLIVTAGAGSGKTRVLVERFMALLDRHPDWTLPSIVAITFTEKAAREMRDRVRGAVEERVRAAVESGDEAALARWLDHRAALTRARIGTIHGLCAALLRANPAEARIDPGFEVLDENEAAMLRDDAVETVLGRLVAENHPAAELLAVYDLREVRQVLRRYADRGQAIENDLYRAAAGIAAEGEPDLLARWAGLWEGLIAGLMSQAGSDSDLHAALDWIGPDDLPPGDKLSEMWQIVHTHRARLLGEQGTAFIEAVGVLAESIKVNVGSSKAWGSKETLDESKAALKLIRERVRALGKGLLPPPGESDAEAARLLFLWAEAIRQAGDVYTQMKRDRGVLDFDDLEARARDLLTQHPAAAARYADPLDGEFKHLLVDEFQDTNAAQRDILYALAGIGLPGSDGRLFVVGDPKQSIYAFRGADVSVFGQVRDDLRARGGVELPLSTSFRTHHNLVMAFNDLFGRILSAGPGDFPLGRGYEVDLGQPMAAFRPSAPEIAPDHACPLVVIALQKPDKDADPEQKINAEALRQAEAWEIAQHIQALVERETPVWDRQHDGYRALDYGDVAILFQSMSSVTVYEEVFKAAGLPYVTLAGRGYYDRQEVWDLLNLLRALHNPADDLALASALRSPLFGLSDEALFALRLMRDEAGDILPLWEALNKTSPPDPLSIQNGEGGDIAPSPLSGLAGEGRRGQGLRGEVFPPSESEAGAFACGVLRELRDLAGRASVADLLIRALDLTGYPAVLTGLPDGARRRGNVEKLVALARASGRVSLGAFLVYARDLTTREVREGEAAVEVEGAVTLMSVHASKGLEFPVVVLADASWGRQSGSRGGREIFRYDPEIGPVCRLPAADPDDDEPDLFAWNYAALAAERRDRAERRRLLYVGATRAQDYLVVSGSLHRCPEHAWLRQWLDALGLAGDDLAVSDETQVVSYEWGGCALRVPLTLSLLESRTPRRRTGASAWDDPAVAAGQPLAGVEPVLPLLLADVPGEPAAPARFLTPTQIAHLGRAAFYDPLSRGRKLFRHSVLYDAPDPLRPLPDPAAHAGDARRLVGDLVHRMLHAWLLPSSTPPEKLAARLKTYAWEGGLSDEALVDGVVAQALDLLAAFDRSETRTRIERAAQVFRELPFMYHWGERTVQGRIDVLYLDGSQWHVLDYKTAPVSPGGVKYNAPQHYLQVGMYALAVEARTGQMPLTQLYYIHPARLFVVKPEQWRPALERLEDDLQAALGSSQADDRAG